MTSMLLATPAWNRSRACVTSSLARPTPWLATSTSLRAAASCAMAVLTCSAIWLRCSCSCCDTLRSSRSARARWAPMRPPVNRIAGAHLRNGHCARIDRGGQVLAEEIEERHEHQPRKDAAGKDDARCLGTDDVAHAQILA